jgi:sialate O-acetylesterase
MLRHARRSCAACIAIALLLSAATAGADLRLPRLLSDGVVLQRDTKATLWGWGDEGEHVAVYLDGEAVGETVVTDGRWRLGVGPRGAGGPHELELAGNNRVRISDVWFGDVWLASGQSNMQLPMSRAAPLYEDIIANANLPLIRHFTVPREYDFDAPREDLDGGRWEVATPQSILELSAAGFFFARDISGRYGVPVGILNCNFGGSAAESWMSEAALEAWPQYLQVARRYRDHAYLEGLIEYDRASAAQWYGDLDRRDAGLDAAMPWFDPAVDDSPWPTMSVPGYWADTGTGPVNGAVWFRRSFELPAGAARRPARLEVGRIIDADTTWINGTEVGNVTYQYPPRRYDVAAGILKAGTNTIVVRVVNSAGIGGFVPDKPYRLRTGGKEYDLTGEWRYRIGALAGPLEKQRFIVHRQPLGFHNAMLAPLLPMRIKGVIWYQGETNANRPAEYEQLFPDMIRDWRENFGQGDFPFIYVQLANYLASRFEPPDYDWPAMREAQRLALREPNTAMAVAIDVGEWNDIHPLDKKTVGERLALAARKIAYGEDIVYSGPMFRAARIEDNSLVVEFDHVGGGLVARGGHPGGFAVAGPDGSFVWAGAEIVGDDVVVHSDTVGNPVAVRYAWADNPVNANLYNREGLPASPFEARVSR